MTEKATALESAMEALDHRSERAGRYVAPCPENGKSHDCAEEYVMWMPVGTFDDMVRDAYLRGVDEGYVKSK